MSHECFCVYREFNAHRKHCWEYRKVVSDSFDTMQTLHGEVGALYVCGIDVLQVRLVVSPGSRGAGVGSRLLSSAVGFAASCRCRSIEVFANSLNASSASFFRNRQFELVQVVRRNLMRGEPPVNLHSSHHSSARHRVCLFLW